MKLNGRRQGEYLESHSGLGNARLHGISRNGDRDSWIELFLSAITQQVQTRTAMVRSILMLYEQDTPYGNQI